MTHAEIDSVLARIEKHRMLLELTSSKLQEQWEAFDRDIEFLADRVDELIEHVVKTRPAAAATHSHPSVIAWREIEAEKPHLTGEERK